MRACGNKSGRLCVELHGLADGNRGGEKGNNDKEGYLRHIHKAINSPDTCGIPPTGNIKRHTKTVLELHHPMWCRKVRPRVMT